MIDPGIRSAMPVSCIRNKEAIINVMKQVLHMEQMLSLTSVGYLCEVFCCGICARRELANVEWVEISHKQLDGGRRRGLSYTTE